MSGRVAFEVEPGDAGSRLDVVLGAHPEVGSRAAAGRLIEAGHVTVGGRSRPKRHVLDAGDSALLDGSSPHGWENLGTGKARALWVILG